MTERIEDLTVALAPEHVRQRPHHRRTDAHGTVPQAVDVIEVQVDCAVCAVEVSWAERGHLGELIGEHHGQVAEAQLHVDQLAVRKRDAAVLPGVESFGIPGRGLGCAVDCQMDGVFSDRHVSPDSSLGVSRVCSRAATPASCTRLAR
jgi:hypothetical protein